MNKEEEALSAEYFKDAAELLEKTYRRFYSGKRESMFVEDLDVLWDNVQPMDGYVFLLSVKKHINDFTQQDDGKNAGDWFPTAANITRWSAKVEEERVADHTKVKQQEEGTKVFLGRKFTTVPIEDPFLQRLMGRRFVECYSSEGARCQSCKDTGQVRFYYYVEKPSHIFMGEEWADLWDRNKEQAELFKMSAALCDDCDMASDIIYKQQEREAKFRQPVLFQLRRLVENRKSKQRQVIRRQDLAAGDQSQLNGDENG
jgi:GR25 family glycosyltransferase involved in LPS biosynthesis